MAATAWPVLYVLFVWWFSTGLILLLVSLDRRTFRWSMLAATALLVPTLIMLAKSSADDSIAGAFAAFTCALLIWGWHEMSFLMGLISGPRTSVCPTGASGWRRAWYAFETILYHEIALVVTALVIIVLTEGGLNRIALWAFMVLWVMRISSKLNVFLGVPNLTEEWLPDHLAFLKSYFRKRPMNLLFPVAVTASTVATVMLVQAAANPQISAAQSVGWTLIAALMALAVLEHWILVLPVPAAALWAWAARRRSGGQPEPETPAAARCGRTDAARPPDEQRPAKFSALAG